MGKVNINRFFENQERLLLNNQKMRTEVAKIGKEPGNARWKYLSLVSILVCLILLLITLIWFDELTDRAKLWLQGFAGVCAIIFLIFITIYLYRVHSKAINHRFHKPTDHPRC